MVANFAATSDPIANALLRDSSAELWGNIVKRFSDIVQFVLFGIFGRIIDRLNPTIQAPRGGKPSSRPLRLRDLTEVFPKVPLPGPQLAKLAALGGPTGRRLALLAAGCLCVCSLQAQSFRINWAADKISCPAQPDTAANAQVVLEKINDLLYGYKVEIEVRDVVPSDIDDFAFLSRLVPSPGAAAAGSCEAQIESLKTELKEVRGLFDAVPELAPKPLPSKLYPSVSLAQTTDAWTGFETDYKVRLDALAGKFQSVEEICGGTHEAEIELLRQGVEFFQDWKQRVAGSHEKTLSETVSLQTGKTYIFVVEEFVEEEGGAEVPTERRGRFECEAQAPVLSLSAGTMYSTLPSRIFSIGQGAQLRPPVDESTRGSDEVERVLAVDNLSGGSLHGLALLNYRLPWFNRANNFGISISSGPVLRLSGDTETSRLGYFAGISLNLYSRLFVTPGIHVGQFSDFPQGLFPGVRVPMDIQTLSPTKRWTTRFAIGLTYRTRSFDTDALRGTATDLPSRPPPSDSSDEDESEDESEEGGQSEQNDENNQEEPSELAIETAALDPGSVDQAYGPVELKATGGTPPYVWEVVDEEEKLPDGLLADDTQKQVFRAEGKLQGTPTTAGTFEFVVSVTDNADTPTPVTKPFTLVVAEASGDDPSALGATALPAGGSLTLERPDFQGSGCSGDTVTYQISGSALYVNMERFRVEAGAASARTREEKSCKVVVPINIPFGFRLGIAGAEYVVSHRVPEKATSWFNTREGLLGPSPSRMNPKGSNSRYEGPLSSEYRSDVVTTNDVAWSPCGGRVSAVLSAVAGVEADAANTATSLEVKSLRFSVQNGEHVRLERCTGR